MKIGKSNYTVKALLPNGNKVNLNGVLLGLDREENDGELSQRVTITLANTATQEGKVSKILKYCTHIYVYYDNDEVFRGIIWEFDHEISSQESLTFVCYDKLIYAQKSSDNFYFSKGLSTNGALTKICNKWNIKLDYNWATHKHGKILYKNQKIADSIINILEDAAKKVGKTYVARMNKGILYINKKGSNSNVYVFGSSEENVISALRKGSLNNLVTKVIVVGKEDKNGKSPVVETKTGKTEYGVLQEIVAGSDSDSIKEAKKEADEILKTRGKPDEQISIQAPDVPYLKKGDRVKVKIGPLNNYFYIKSISHSAASMTMSAELERV